MPALAPRVSSHCSATVGPTGLNTDARWSCTQRSRTTAALAGTMRQTFLDGKNLQPGSREDGVVFLQQISEKGSRCFRKFAFRLCDSLCSGILTLERGHSAREKLTAQRFRGLNMLKILTATVASLAMLSAAAAADLPRKEPPPPAPPVGKAPIGKYPVGKAPIGKYPQPVVTKG